MNEHQGQTIEYIVRRNGYNISDLARALGVNRRTLYNYFKSPLIKSKIIYQAGCVVRHDFSEEFPELFAPGEFDAAFEQTSSLSLNYNQPQNEDAEYKSKYLELLEKYHELLNALSETNRFNATPHLDDKLRY
ncbi:MAG: TetR family transcriptional regulator [Mucilaginibacter sp.]|nr:TetR family transcriptional regulator [Mucilaginibacter sp.]